MKLHNVYTPFHIAHNITEKKRILTINDLLCSPYIPEISSPSIRDVLSHLASQNIDPGA